MTLDQSVGTNQVSVEFQSNRQINPTVMQTNQSCKAKYLKDETKLKSYAAKPRFVLVFSNMFIAKAKWYGLDEIRHMLFSRLLCLVVIKLFLLLLSIAPVSVPGLAAENGQSPEIIIHAGEHSDKDYVLQLLSAALVESGNKYTLKALGYFPPRGRDFIMMEQKQGIDIMWGSARTDREARFRTIRIPIFKGLIGWRIPLLTQANADMFKSTHNLDDIKAFRPGQHFRWTDTKILKDNGINVFEANNHASLMGMLINNKFDYYPRAVIEIIPEFEEFKSQGVIIDSHIIISYPSAFYFYVHKDNTALAQNLTQGLESLIDSGDMDRLFFRHFGSVLKQLAVHQRTLLRLNNSYIPDKAPFDRKELWLDPQSLPNELIPKSSPTKQTDTAVEANSLNRN